MNKRAFTLIELLVVIAIIGILSSSIFAVTRSSKDKAKTAKSLQFSQSINHALGAYAVGIWRFDEEAGAIAYDSSSYGKNGSIIGATFTKGILGSALVFNGSNASVNTPYVQENVTAYTIEVWVKTTDAGIERVFVQDRGPSPGTGRSLTLGMGQTGGMRGGPGQVGFEVDSQNIDIGIHSVRTINDGSWHHVAGTWSAPAGTLISTSQFKIYIDGAEASVIRTPTAGAGSISSPLTGSGGTKIARHDAWGTWFNGTLDEVRIYSSVLTVSQIQKHYAEGLEKYKLAEK